MNKCIFNATGDCSNDMITISANIHICLDHAVEQEVMWQELNEEEIQIVREELILRVENE